MIIDFASYQTRQAPRRPAIGGAPPRLVDALDGYAAALRARKRRPRGVKLYLKMMRRIIATLGTASTQADITPQTIRRYLEANTHLSSSSIENMLYGLRCFCRWAIEEGLRADDPTEAIVWPRVTHKAPDRLKEVEIATLLTRVRIVPATVTGAARWRWKRNALAVYVMLYAGLRLAEAADLRWRDIDLAARELIVRSEAAKGGDERVVPLNRHLVNALESVPLEDRDDDAGVIPIQPGGRPISFKGLERVFDRWAPVATTVHAHQLRHAFATRMHRRNIPVRTIQVLLGHKSLETTQRYLGLDPGDAAAAVEVLDW